MNGKHDLRPLLFYQYRSELEPLRGDGLLACGPAHPCPWARLPVCSIMQLTISKDQKENIRASGLEALDPAQPCAAVFHGTR